MLSLLDFFSDLTNPALSFLPKALIVAVLSAVVCGAVGAHVVLRQMAFIGDAVSHAVFPGIAVAFIFNFSLIAGGAAAGALVAIGVAALSQRRRIKEDSLIGIFFAAAFAIGLIIMSRAQGYTASLTSFLFGSLTGVSTEDIALVAVVTVGVLAVLAAFHSRLVAVALDRETAQAMGLKVLALDLVLYLTVTAAVVISVQTIGNILVLALLITPAATARLLTRRIETMMVVSALLGAASSVVGLYLSWALDYPTGATIVVTVTVVFCVVWAGSRLGGRR